MTTAIYAFPAGLVLIVVDVLAVALVCAGFLAVRRAFPHFDFVQHNEVAGYIVSVIGTLYAVMLAFIIAIVWQEYDASQARVGTEAAAATDVWHAAAGLRPDVGQIVRVGIVDYAHVMVDDEWPAMRHGRSSARSEPILTRLITTVARLRTRDAGEAQVQGLVLGKLSQVHEMRRDRLHDNASGIAPFEWLVLAIGAGVVIGFCYLFGLANERALMMMICAVALMIASLWVLVAELDYPFRGELAVSASSWQSFLERVAGG